MKFTQIPTDVFKEFQLNAGILLSTFSPEAPTIERSNIIGATTGGITFTDTPEYVDDGEDIDNCPKNVKQLKRIVGREVKLAGTFISADAERVKSLIGAADVHENEIVPRNNIEDTDFTQLWWVGDYSDENGATNGGYIAISMSNAFNHAGFSIKSGDDAKGQFAFEYVAHVDLASPDTVPYAIYVKAGTAEPVL